MGNKKQNRKGSHAVQWEDKMSFGLRTDERVGSSIIVLTGAYYLVKFNIR